jgi:hypothetical protein
MNIANRSAVAQEILSRFAKDTVEFYECADTMPYFYVRMMRDVLEGGKSVVIENSWRDDYVLEAMGESAKIPKEYRRMLDRLALGCNAVIAYCRADTRTYAANLNKNLSYEVMKTLIDKMDSVWAKLESRGLAIVTINSSDSGFKTDVDALFDRANYHIRNSGPGIGLWNPGKVILLVGDRHGPSIQPYKVDMNIAFCDMAKAGSSHWLSAQLDLMDIPESRLYWINAYDSVGAATHSDFVGRLYPITVLSLGDNAKRWCDTNHIRHEPFTHPQYHKRFHSKEPYPLIARLKELIDELS